MVTGANAYVTSTKVVGTQTALTAQEMARLQRFAPEVAKGFSGVAGKTAFATRQMTKFERAANAARGAASIPC